MELLLGLLAIVTGCFSSALGFQLMKLSSVVEAGVPLYRAPRWLAGFFLLAVVQTLADALSLSFLPLSVVAPFAGLTICFTLLLASSGLFGEPEQLGPRDLFGGAPFESRPVPVLAVPSFPIHPGPTRLPSLWQRSVCCSASPASPPSRRTRPRSRRSK